MTIITGNCHMEILALKILGNFSNFSNFAKGNGTLGRDEETQTFSRISLYGELLPNLVGSENKHTLCQTATM